MNSLMSYMPKYYKNSAFIIALSDSIEAELERLFGEVYSVKAESQAATSIKRLELWERSVHLASDTSLSTAQRQSRVLARLRQIDTTTKERIQAIVSAFTNGEVDVTENFGEYTVTIEFVSLRGKPDNMEGIITQLQRIMPAHLVINFNYKYRTWGEVAATGMTWRELYEKGYTWRDLMEKEVL